MNIFFDIDQTLIYPGTRKIRPYAKWSIGRIQKAGHRVFLWSHRGEQNCWDVAKGVGVSLNNCYDKPPFENLFDAAHIPHVINYCVDDDPKDMPMVFPGLTVLPYCAEYEPQDDQEMLRVLDILAPGPGNRKKPTP